MRHLISTRRRVEPGRVARYLESWATLRAAAAAADVRAWLFRSADEPGTYLEFLESSDTAALEAPPLRAARRALDDEIGGGREAEWVEARTGRETE